MFWRMVRGALVRRRAKRLTILLTIALGASLATGMLNVMFDVGDKVNQELKAYGANINVQPTGTAVLGELYALENTDALAQAHLAEDDLGKIKTIFWAFNIVDFAPYLETEATIGGSEATLVGTWFQRELSLPTGEVTQAGMRNMKSWWDVTGEWLTDTDDGAVMVGSALAARHDLQVGETITVDVAGRTTPLLVKGIIDAGGDEDEQAFVPLRVVQDLEQLPGAVGRIEVSALTTPDNELSRRAAQDPDILSIKDWETWYCTAYASSISYQIEEAIPGSVAKPIRQVAESEGAILEKTQLLMLLITGLSLVGAALGISNLVTASVMERAPEIGLLKAVGATDGAVLLLVLVEIAVVGTVGGVLGYFAGLGVAQIIGQTVFGSAISIKPVVIPLVAVLVSLVILAGSLPSIRLLLSLRPAEVLHGR
jgi:putative ABC transport system permease protein